jgi:sulfatase maturation enzyme AslB (radical SAM superfamily)
MISASRLLCGLRAQGDPLRYERSGPVRPVVVWNVTRTCNLRCIHCYAEAENVEYPGELSTEQALAVVDDLADFGVPVILFSGGEPLLREDLFALAARARDRGIRCVLSTNATLIDTDTARRLKDAGFSYIGVSIDGIDDAHDRMRGKRGAFGAALEGLRRCREAGLRRGLRFTLTRLNCPLSSSSSRRRTYPGSASTTWCSRGGATGWSASSFLTTRRARPLISSSRRRCASASAASTGRYSP